MKLSKGQGISCFAAVVLFGIFTTVSFLFPLEHTASFWLGYFFAIFALLTLLLSLIFFFEKTVNEEKALNIPVVTTAWLYLVVQAGLSFKEMTLFPTGYMVAVAANLGLALLFTVLILTIAATASKTAKKDAVIREKISYIKDMKSQIEYISTDDQTLKVTLKKLAEDVRFSDPMSHSQLEDIENELKSKVTDLENNINDVDKANAICNEISKLLKMRNDKCKSLKGVKDPVKDVSDKPSGNKIALAGVGVTLLIFAVALTVVFIILPNKLYKAACVLMDAEQYEEAIVAFEALDGFKDSEAKIEEIQDILNGIEDKENYDKAVELHEQGKLDEALEIFLSLGDYEDSSTRIDEINGVLIEKEYEEGIVFFDAGNYIEAAVIFKEINGYKESSAKLQEIEAMIAGTSESDDVEETLPEENEVRISIVEALESELASNNIEVAINRESGTVVLNSDILFAGDSYKLNQNCKDFLDSFLPTYFSILLSDDYRDKISEIVIEGHTAESSDYMGNLTLSQKRAYAVAEYIFRKDSGIVGPEDMNALKSMITVNGRASSDPVYKEDGSYDRAGSRRVEIKFRLINE